MVLRVSALTLDTIKKGRIYSPTIDSEEKGAARLFRKTVDRRTRSFALISTARQFSEPVIKIVLYCSALECLFSTQSSELTHQIAERSAWFCSADSEKRVALYSLVKDAYRIRSKIVHGSTLSAKDETQLIEVIEKIDDLLR
jgi:hypothetical protein